MAEPAVPSTVLVVNAGSSSLKVKLVPQGWSGLVERIGGDAKVKVGSDEVSSDTIENHEDAFRVLLEHLSSHTLETVTAVGHRVVHGGERYTEPTLLTDKVVDDLEALVPLAPLHNPANLAGVRAARRLLPHVPQVAVFDTAFHATLPPSAFLYGLPLEFYTQQGIRRYGFHGTSHDYVTRRAAELLGRPRADLRLVSLHLGNGSSAAAVAGGRSVDTSMGFTPLSGLLMGTRTGDIDPGVLLYLLQNGMDAGELDTLLNKRSGLLGLSGVSNDMRDVRRAAEAGNKAAREAVAVFCYRIRKTIGAYAAAMSGLDAVVFTGGIGENDADTRAAAVVGLEFLGLTLDETKNRAGGEGDISAAGSSVRTLVIPTDEEGEIARATLELLRAGKGQNSR